MTKNDFGKQTESWHAEICFRDNKPAIKHTPGPFTYRRDYDETFDFVKIVTCCEEERVLACILDNEVEWSAQIEANALLFAAAPELLQALDAMLLAGPCRSEQYDAAVAKALAAIAKVEGRRL